MARVAGAAVPLAVSPDWAVGAGAAMPWDVPLDTLMRSLSGPVAKAMRRRFATTWGLMRLLERFSIWPVVIYRIVPGGALSALRSEFSTGASG